MLSIVYVYVTSLTVKSVFLASVIYFLVSCAFNFVSLAFVFRIIVSPL